MNRWRVGLAALALVVVAVLSGGAMVSKANGASLFENCLDWGEYSSMTGGTMSQVEARYGITGRVVHVGDGRTTLIKQYSWCGYGQSAIFVQIAYYLNKRGQWVAQYVIVFDLRGYPYAHHPTRSVTERGDPEADTRPCVDNREANGLHERIGRTELERRWEVTGLGQRMGSPVFGDIVIYPWCDHGDTTQAWIGVSYGGANGRVAVGLAWWKAEWS